MKRSFLLLALVFFAPAAAAYGQDAVEAYNTSIIAGRSQALSVLDGTGEDARFQSITSMRGDGAYLYLADAMTIRRVELATARVTTLSQTAGTGIHRFGSNSGFAYNYFGLYGLWSDGVSLYATDVGAGTIRKIDLTTGGVRTVAGGLGFAWGLSGNGTTLYAASAASGTVMRIDAVTGTSTQLASTGSGTPRNCFLGSGCLGYFVPGPRDMWSDGQNLYLTGYSGTVKKLDIASGEQTFLPPVPFNIGPIAGAAGQLFVGAISGPQLGSIRLDTGEFAPIALPADNLYITALWSDGVSLYVAQGQVIRRIDLATGDVSTFAGLSQATGFANGAGTQARFWAPLGISGDSSTFYVADSGNFSIRKVDPATGTVTQIAGSPAISAIQDGFGESAAFSRPVGLFDDGTSLFVTDAHSIRRVSLDTAEVRTIAGTGTVSGARDGAGTDAQFWYPSGLWGSNSILYIADTSNGVIRQLNTATNEVTTLAGAFRTYGEVDGPIDSARFRVPTALWGDGAILYVADLNFIRAISLNAGTVRTVATLPSVGAVQGLWGNGNSLYTFAVTGSPLARLYLYRILIDTGEISPVVHGSSDVDAGSPIFLDGAGGISGSGTDLFITDDRDNTVRHLTRDAPPSFIRSQITDPGYLSRSTAGRAASVSAGYARITADAGSVTAAGFAVFALQQNGVLISEASVPAAHAIRSGRTIAVAGSAVNTGIAIANPNSTAANISFYFTDAAGQNSLEGSFTLGPGAQIARFLTEPPFKGPAVMNGTVTFISPVPVSAVALRGYVNERSEFLMSTLPVADISSQSNAPAIVTHFANGGGWTTDLTLVNPSDQAISGSLQVIGANSSTITASIYAIAARASQNIHFQAAAGTTTTGAIRVIPQIGAAPSAVCIFSFISNGVRVTEAGVSEVPPAVAFHLYTEEGGNIFQRTPGTVRSGLAITNPSATPVDLTVELTDAQGSMFFPSTSTIHVDAMSHVSLFLDETSFSGPSTFGPHFLRVSSPGPAVSVVGLRGRYNERGDFLITITPAIPEDTTPDTQPLYFPHFVNGGGYTTQFILFPATTQSTGTSLSITMHYFDQAGAPMILPTR